MKELRLRGHQPAETYPSEATDIDFSPPAVRPRPQGQQLFASPAGSLRGVHYDPNTGRYLLVCRSGTTNYLYIRSGTNNTLLSSWNDAIADAQISFVPLQDLVVVVARSRIFLVNTNSQNATQVTKPSQPSGVTASALQQYLTMTNYLPAATDRCDVSYAAPFFTVDDNTSDPPVGAYQQLYATTQQDVTHCDDAFLRIENFTNDLVAATAAPIMAERAGNQDFYAGPSVNAKTQGWIQLPLTAGKLNGVHLWLDSGALKVHERLYFCPRTRPLRYRVARTQNGFEGDPLEIAVTTNAANCPAPAGYIVQIQSLPSGTWRIYRQDALGDWRLVAEGTGNTFTDTKRDEELGSLWRDPVYPHQGGAGAILWQGRIVLTDGDTKLYISERGRYAWEDDSDIVQFPSRIRGLASIGGRLYVNHSGAWWELLGSPGSWLQRKTFAGHAPRPPLGCYLSDCALATEDLLHVPSPSGWTEVRLNDSIFWSWALPHGVAARGTEATFFYQQARWARWTINALAIWYANGRIEYAQSDGVYALNGSPVQGARLVETVPLDRRIASVRLYADGSGSVSVKLNASAAETWTLPHLRDRWRVDDWTFTLEMEMNANASLKRLLADVEASSAYD